MAPAAIKRISPSSARSNWAILATARRRGARPDRSAPCAADMHTILSAFKGAPEGHKYLMASHVLLAACLL
eukprot:7643553-Pyramimonas_sp.AAC.1